MPTVNEVPKSLHPLAQLQAVNLDTGIDFNVHIRRLITAIEARTGLKPRWWRRWWQRTPLPPLNEAVPTAPEHSPHSQAGQLEPGPNAPTVAPPGPIEPP